MNDFLAKPFVVEELIAKLHSNTRTGPSHRSAPPRPRTGEIAQGMVVGEVFNELEALDRSGGNRALMVAQICLFLKDTPGTISLLRRNAGAGDDPHLFEQGVHGLKQQAMAIGATNFADEVFILQMQIRKGRKNDEMGSHLDTLAEEFDRFRKDPTVQGLVQFETVHTCSA